MKQFTWLIVLTVATLLWFAFGRQSREEVPLNELITIEGEGINWDFPEVELFNGTLIESYHNHYGDDAMIRMAGVDR